MDLGVFIHPTSLGGGGGSTCHSTHDENLQGLCCHHLEQHFPPDFPDFPSLPQQPPTPSFLRMISNGQKLVKEDWRRLKPTKAVSQSQFGLK
jgi:hypothetical protein